MKISWLFLFATVVSVQCAYNHPGRLDENSGHIEKKTGRYHHHRVIQKLEVEKKESNSIQSDSTLDIDLSKDYSSSPRKYLAKKGILAFEHLKNNYPIVHDRAIVDGVALILSELLDTGPRNTPLTEWEFVILDLGVQNAGALPGGKIAINKGILDYVESDDELAFILAHEIGHVTGEHHLRAMNRAGWGILIVGLLDGLEASGKISSGYSDLASGSLTVMGLGFNRRDERESDLLGVLYMAAAGYNPVNALTFFERHMKHTQGVHIPKYLSTHPPDEIRLARLKENLPAAISLYEDIKNGIEVPDINEGSGLADFLEKKAIDLARKSHQAKPLSLVTFVKRPMLKNEASVSIHQLEDRRPFLRRNSKHIARTSTLGDQTMAFFKSEEIITEWLSEQLTAEINTAGNFSQNLSIQGNLNEFHIFTKPTITHWDIIGEIDITLFAKTENGDQLYLGDFFAQSKKRTFVWPTKKLIGKVAGLSVKNVSMEIIEFINQL